MLLLLGAAGCSAPTAACDDPGAATSTWQYAGTQTTPLQASLAGTLAITAQCGVLTGELSVVELDGLGQSRRLSGPVTGRMVDGTSMRFDVLINGVMRQHLARVSGDSLSGTWLALSENGGQSWTGSFRGHREAGR